jgi:hypothetical protein
VPRRRPAPQAAEGLEHDCQRFVLRRQLGIALDTFFERGLLGAGQAPKVQVQELEIEFAVR